jgi:hypothetical protein
MAGATYREAEGPRKVAKPYLDKYHPHVKNIKVEYLFIDKPIRINGQERPMKVQRVSGLNAYLATCNDEPEAEFVVVIINEEVWKLYDDSQREAVMDMALMYISVDQESGSISLRSEDVHGFSEILERHGAWEPNLKNFIEAAKNPTLPGLEDAVGSAGKGKGNGKSRGGAVKHIPRERASRPKKESTVSEF